MVASAQPVSRQFDDIFHAKFMQVHESLSSVPSGFTRNGPLSADATIKLRIALKQNNMEGLIDTLYDVSTPTSANYGQYLSAEEVRKMDTLGISLTFKLVRLRVFKIYSSHRFSHGIDCIISPNCSIIQMKLCLVDCVGWCQMTSQLLLYCPRDYRQHNSINRSVTRNCRR